MNRFHRLLSIVAALGLAGSLTLALSGCGPATRAQDTAAAAPVTTATEPADAAAPAPEKRLPRLVDIGAGTCIPCRLMKPILDDLKTTRAHQFETVFVDLNHERAKGMSFRIRLIPTQVFFGEDGRELGRHEGFMSKEDILKAWQQLGYHFEAQ